MALVLLIPAADLAWAQAQLDFVPCYARRTREACMNECVGTLIGLCPCLYDSPLFPESLETLDEQCPEDQTCCFNMPPERWDVSIVGAAEAEESCLEGGAASSEAIPELGIVAYEGSFEYVPNPAQGESTCRCRPPLVPVYAFADIASLPNAENFDINAPFDCVCPYMTTEEWLAQGGIGPCPNPITPVPAMQELPLALLVVVLLLIGYALHPRRMA